MKSFNIFLIEESQKQKQAQLAHDTAIKTLLKNKNFVERTDKPHPSQLKPFEYAVYEPGETSKFGGTQSKSDMIINFEGHLIPTELKGKSPEKKKSKTGVHQNDYTIPKSMPVKVGSLRRFIGNVQSTTTPETIVSSTTSDAPLKSYTRLWPKEGKIRQVAQKLTKQFVPKMMEQLGSHITISGSKKGVAVVHHKNENDPSREITHKFLKHLGLESTHESKDLGTAGSPYYRSEGPERGSRGFFRVSVPVTEKNKASFEKNASLLYPN
jgi:hypothetical protein